MISLEEASRIPSGRCLGELVPRAASHPHLKIVEWWSNLWGSGGISSDGFCPGRKQWWWNFVTLKGVGALLGAPPDTLFLGEGLL